MMELLKVFARKVSNLAVQIGKRGSYLKFMETSQQASCDVWQMLLWRVLPNPFGAIVVAEYAIFAAHIQWFQSLW
jgi:hypothetical protein